MNEAPKESSATTWFSHELQPHEPKLRAWLRSRFPFAHDIDDIVQEAYVRVLRANEHSVIASPKAFLFATARNLALGELRHQHIERTEPLTEINEASVLDEGVGPSDAIVHRQELELLTQAIQSLPARCRQVITLRKIYGLSQKEVAAQLGISEHTVEAQGTIGLRKMAHYFENLGLDSRFRP